MRPLHPFKGRANARKPEARRPCKAHASRGRSAPARLGSASPAPDNPTAIVSPNVWTLPNVISWLRILLAGPVIALLVTRQPWAMWAALACMIAAELSDWLDGHIARRSGQISAVGKVLDPMADSLYRVSVFTAFAANHWMPLWMLLIIAGRDVVVSYLRLVAERSLGTMGARQSGKWKAVAQGIAQIAVVASYALWGIHVPDSVALGLWAALVMATVVTAYSLVDYSVSVLKAVS